MVSFVIADTVIVGNPIKVRGDDTIVQVGNVYYVVPTIHLRPFNPRKQKKEN